MSDKPTTGSDCREIIKNSLKPLLVSEPLKSKIDRELKARKKADDDGQPRPLDAIYEVIIEINLNNAEGRAGGSAAIKKLLHEILGEHTTALSRNRDGSTHPYIFASLTAAQITDLVTRDGNAALDLDAKNIQATQDKQDANDAGDIGDPATAASTAPPQATVSSTKTKADDSPSSASDGGTAPKARRTLRSIFRIWESQPVHPLITESVRTVKANAAHNSFSALGENIVWAVLDSGIDADHSHFAVHDNLTLAAPLAGKSTSFLDQTQYPWDKDPFGHGTHVAGIIAGESTSPQQAAIASTDEAGNGEYHLIALDAIKGMAPRTRLLILRVLDDNGNGDETALIQAIEYIQQLNDFGRHIVVHGVNISAGFPAHPTWYACGQTPLCTEINLLVNCGVTVVVAAGNSGHVLTPIDSVNYTEAGQMVSINDPGNADLAITVGSTHRQAPHTYGISYFSSKGPTSDGRRKPEVVAPGEKIISAASGDKTGNKNLLGLAGAAFGYIEDTGTSMAAPHVSGVLAAFLSAKREFIGEPEKTKALLVQSAMDLGRDPNLQGAGLVDLMKLIQSV